MSKMKLVSSSAQSQAVRDLRAKNAAPAFVTTISFPAATEDLDGCIPNLLVTKQNQYNLIRPHRFFKPVRSVEG